MGKEKKSLLIYYWSRTKSSSKGTLAHSFRARVRETCCLFFWPKNVACAFRARPKAGITHFGFTQTLYMIAHSCLRTLLRIRVRDAQSREVGLHKADGGTQFQSHNFYGPALPALSFGRQPHLVFQESPIRCDGVGVGGGALCALPQSLLLGRESFHSAVAMHCDDLLWLANGL